MTSISHEHFFQKIKDAKGEDLLLAQQMYFDWLTEQGDRRAELLSLSIEIRRDYPEATRIYNNHLFSGGQISQNFFMLLIRLIAINDSTATLWLKKTRIVSTKTYPDKSYWLWSDAAFVF